MRPEIEYVYNKLKKLRFDFKSSDFRDFRSYYRYDPELMRYVRKDDNDLFIDKNTFKSLEEELEYADSCHKIEEELGCPLEVVFKALKEENARYKVLEKELKSEINVLFSYMEFTKLFFEIFNLNYSNETFTLSLIPNEQYNIENVDLKICLIKEDADKILKVAELLEKEVLE